VRRRRAFLISLLACLAVFVPQITAAAIPAEQPVLNVADAPIVRNTKVRLEFSQPGGYGIQTYLASNDPSMNGSTLANGVVVPQSSNWTLAGGADGPRTIYGQVEYSSGGWSQVVELNLVLATNGGNSLYVDLDRQNGTNKIALGPNGDWHTRSKKPDKPIYGEGGPGPGNQLAVSDDNWRVSFRRSSGPLGPGSFNLGSGACSGGACEAVVSVAGDPSNDCVASSGKFTIFALNFGSGGDLLKAEVDFLLKCGSNRMAGSIRYGANRAVLALDQDAERLIFDTSPVGVATAAKSVTFRNIGNTKVVLGNAAFTGSAKSNFDKTSDNCSGVTLGINASCVISVAFDPTTTGDLTAILALPDNTPSGSRWVQVTGSGGAAGPVTVTAPVTEFNTNGYVDENGLIRVRVNWSSSGSVARYELAQQTDDDGNWVVLATNLTSTNYDAFLTSRHRYNFRVRAIDGAGNATGWATGQSGWLWPHNETSGDITFSGSWRLMYPTCLYWDWGSNKSSQAGASATYSFHARSVAWVARKGPDRGSVNVYLDGTKVATLDLYANSFKDRQLVYVKNFASVGDHVLKIEVLGTSGHPYADVDAFAILD
jgi:hypothetical protein